jgi:hypothetical protein
MEAGAGTPLLDLFKKGGVDRDIRLMAAQGVLGLRHFEQVGVCELLSSDSDPEVAEAASALLRGLSGDGQESPAQAEPVVEESDRQTAEGEGEGGEGEPESDDRTALQKIAAMSPAQRLALAMKGTREERAILVRDPNRIVAVAVLSSPKISEAEVESIAKMANVQEEILRIIGHTRAWLKKYAIVSALAKNPKTPLGVSLTLLPRLLEREVKALSTDRNVPETLRIAARKRMTEK